jgi:hypothetical protein
MATKKRTKQTREHATDFPGATEDKFGNQYFEKQGTEHSSRAPYDHGPAIERNYDPAGTSPSEVDDPAHCSSENCEVNATDESDASAPYGTARGHKASVGNKDEYQGGDATKR